LIQPPSIPSRRGLLSVRGAGQGGVTFENRRYRVIRIRLIKKLNDNKSELNETCVF
jgi:hypothetical protein